jgi:signal transduction histidine kinase
MMSLRTQLMLAILGAVAVAMFVELFAGETIERAVEDEAARGWLASVAAIHPDGLLGDEVEDLASELRALQVDGAFAVEAAAAHLALSGPGRVWRAFAVDGRVVAERVGGCGAGALDAATLAGSVVVCGRAPYVVKRVAAADGAAIVYGMPLGEEFVRRLALFAGSEVALVGPDGVLSSSVVDEAGRPAFDEAAARRAAGSARASGFARAELTIPAYRRFAGPTQVVELTAAPFTAYVATAPFGADPSPLGVVYWVPEAAVPYGDYVTTLIVAGTMLVVPVLLLVAFLAGRRITRPLVQLADAAARMSRDRLEPIVVPGLRGEVAQLAAALNDLITGINEAKERGMNAEKMAAVGTLAGGVAHEINNPLGVILGFAQGMERRVPEGDPLRTPVTWIVREALRCKALVQELLVFSRTGKSSSEPVDVEELVRATATLLDSRGKTQGVEVVCEVPSGLGPVHANRTQLQQILVNLGSNALDAMATGGTLTLRAQADGDGSVLEVQDTGSGIDEAVRARMFEPFFTTKGVGKGTGLGLSIVHEVVQQHGGRIDVDSAPGRGTRVRVSLPTGGAS